MEANELRVGNFVYKTGRNTEIHRPTEIPVKICEIGLLKSKVLKNDELFFRDDPAEISNFDLAPISLTEEWLFKFGFNFQDGKYWSDGLSVHTTNRDFYIIQEQGRVFIKYVHQFQNLYFALTGKELTLN